MKPEFGTALSIVEERKGPLLILSLAGRIEGRGADDFRNQLERRVDSGDNCIVLECGGLEHMVPAGFRALLHLAKRLQSREGQLFVCGLRERLHAEARTFSGPAGPLALFRSRDEVLIRP